MKKMLSIKQRVELYELIYDYTVGNVNPTSIFVNKRVKRDKNKEAIYNEIGKKLQNSIPLDVAISFHIPSDEAQLFRIGSDQESLGDMLKSMIRIILAKEKAAKTFKAAAAKPAIIVTLSFIIILLFLYLLAPLFLSTVENPTVVSKILIPLAKVSFPIVVFSSLAYAIFSVFALSKLKKGIFRNVLDKYFFPFNSYKSMVSTISMLSAASSIKGGVPIVQLYGLKSKKANAYEKSWFEIIDRNLKSSKADVVAMDVGFYNEDDVDLLYDYQSSQGFANALENISIRALDRLSDRVATQVKSISILVGAVAFFMIIGVISMLAYHVGVGIIDQLVPVL
jgi:type II secretory pathway component PulF